MRSMGFPELIVRLGSLISFGVPLWLAIKAKPLGDRPYRWGHYMGIETALLSLVLLFSAISAIGNGAVLGGVAFCVITLCAAAAATGVIRRKRWGVVFFFITYGLLLLLPPLVDIFPVLLLLVINIFYFKKRWQLMDKPKGS
jgi:hypothetical protein